MISHAGKSSVLITAPGGRGTVFAPPQEARRNPDLNDREFPDTGALEKSMATFSKAQAVESVAECLLHVTADVADEPGLEGEHNFLSDAFHASR